MNNIEQIKERIKFLEAKIVGLIRRRIEIENNMLGKDSIIYVGSSYFEMLFCTLSKNMTKAQKLKLNERYAKLRTASKKAYNQHNLVLLEQNRNEEKVTRKKLKIEKQSLKNLIEKRERLEKNELVSALELFGKPYDELDEIEKIGYERANTRVRNELKRRD